MNMTQGSPLKLIIKFMIPVFLGNVFQQFYNIIDTMVVGRCLGVQALAAVGATGSISFLVFGFMNGLTTGFTIPVAQAFGEGNYEKLRKCVGSAAVLAVIVTAVVTVAAVCNMKWVLIMMRVPEDIFPMAQEYITIICAGMFCSIFYGLLSGILCAIGNSKVPLYFLMIATVINIILDLVLIAWVGMGVAGAAIATLVSQMISGLCCFFYIIRKVPVLKMSAADWKLNAAYGKQQVCIGIPMALQFSITAFGTMLTQTALNTFGSTIVGSYIVAGKVEQIVNQPFDALGVTMATYSAQNWGTHNLNRVRKGCRIANLISAAYAVIVFVVINPLVPYAVRLFINENIEMVTGYAKTYILIGTSFFIPLGMILIFRNVLQGCGYALIPMLGGVIELVSRACAAYFAVRFASYIGVCSTNAAAWLTTGIYLLTAYLIVMKRLKRSVSAA